MYKIKIVILEVQEIDYDILESLDAMYRTRDEMLRIGNDADGFIKVQFSWSRCLYYEFSKKHRPRRPPKRIDEHAGNSAALDLKQHYRQEMFKVIDRLIRDINDINDYISTRSLSVQPAKRKACAQLFLMTLKTQMHCLQSCN